MSDIYMLNHTCDCGLRTRAQILPGPNQWYCDRCGALIIVNLIKES